MNTDKRYQKNLVPVGRQLREELNRCGEHVTPSTLIDPVEGRIWKKSPDGKLREITMDSKKVLVTLDHYRDLVEATRKRCSESRRDKPY